MSMCVYARALIYSIYIPLGEVGAAENFLQVNSRVYGTLVHSWNAWDGYRSVLEVSWLRFSSLEDNQYKSISEIDWILMSYEIFL